MMKTVQKNQKRKLLLFGLLGIAYLFLTVSSSFGQAFTQNFNGTFPPTGPPSVSDPLGTGTSDGTEVPPGQVKWYRSDDPILGTTSAGQFPNAGLDPGNGGVGFSAVFDTWAISNLGKADLIFNNVNMTSFTFPRLTFFLKNTSGADAIRVFVRKTNTWVQVGASSYVLFPNWSQQTIILNGFGGPTNDSVDIRFEATSDFALTNYGLDDVALDEAPPMTFDSTYVAQVTGDVYQAYTRQAVLRVEIKTQGANPALSASSFSFTTTGTTNVADISNAKLWFTGNSTTFDTTIRFGNVVASPNGAFTITGTPVTLNPNGAINYFWLSYDISSAATIGNVIDGTYTGATVGGNAQIPTITTAAGSRTIKAPVLITAMQTENGTSASARAPVTNALFNRACAIYPVAEMSKLPSGATITALAYSTATAPTASVSGNIKVYMVNTTDATYLKSTTWATLLTTPSAMKKVYDGALTIPATTGKYTITFDSAFTYTGAGVYVAFEWNITSALTASNLTSNCNQDVAAGNKSSTSTTLAGTNTLTLSSAFRPAITLTTTQLLNDANVQIVYALGNNPVTFGAPQTVSAVVKNLGAAEMLNYPVSLAIKGANVFANSQNVNLPTGASTTVNFSPRATILAGADTLTVSVGNDNNNANNSATFRQVNNSNLYGYGDLSAVTGSIGYNTGAGLLLNRYNSNGFRTVDSVRIFLANNAATAGKTIFAVVTNAAGTILAKSADYSPVAGDLNKYKTLALSTTKVVNGDFYVGLGQVANATGYFPVGTQPESPGRANGYYTAPLAGGVTPTANGTLGRFMLEAYIGTPATPPVVNIGVDTSICAGSTIQLNAANAGLKYLWSTGDTTQTINVSTAGTYTVTVTNSQGYPVSDSRIVTVDPILPVSANIAAVPSGTICAGQSVTFTATPTNGGTAPTYQWLKNGSLVVGQTGVTYTSTSIVNGDLISVSMVSNEKCKSGSPDTSNVIAMSVSAGAAPVTINVASSSPSGSCAGSSVTFTATPSNGGSAPVYSWKKNGVLLPSETAITYTTSTLVNNDSVTCTITSNSACIQGAATVSNGFKAKVNPVLPVSVSVGTSAVGAICKGASVTFTATPVNGGTGVTYAWYKNSGLIANQSASTYTTTSISNLDTVNCVVTSSEVCQSGGPATSNKVITTVAPSATSVFTANVSKRSASFVNTSLNATAYIWDFGDNSGTVTTQNANHTYAQDGTYQVKLIAVNVCENDTLTQDVIISTIDVRPTSTVGLASGCALSQNTFVRVNIENTRAVQISNLNVAYSVNGGTPVLGTVPSIAGNATQLFQFTTRANLAADGVYTIKLWTADTSDFDKSNDTIVVVVVNQAAPVAGFNTAIGTNGLVNFTNTTSSDVPPTFAWDFGDTGTSTSESPSHTYTQTGTYNVSMIATSTCGSDTTSDSVTVIVSGVELQANEKFVKAYPNPTTGLFTIDVQLAKQDQLSLKVFNTNGQLMFTQTVGKISKDKIQVDASSLSPGIYNVVLEGTSTHISKRIQVLQ